MSPAQRSPAKYQQTQVAGRCVPLILSVDDDPDISRSIEMQLRDYEVTVKQAFFGIQGLWEAIQETPDLIVLDMVMPNGNGHFVLERLKHNPQSAAIPVIVLSGSRDRNLCNLAFELGAAQFLQKPVAFADLLHQMRRFIDVRERASLRNHDGITTIGKGLSTVAERDNSNRIERRDLGSRGAQ